MGYKELSLLVNRMSLYIKNIHKDLLELIRPVSMWYIIISVTIQEISKILEPSMVCFMPVILAFKSLRQEDHKFEANLYFIANSVLDYTPRKILLP